MVFMVSRDMIVFVLKEDGVGCKRTLHLVSWKQFDTGFKSCPVCDLSKVVGLSEPQFPHR